MQKKPLLISGIQPSGSITIGNYIGAIKHFLALQDTYESCYMVVDQHAITVKQNPETLHEKIYDLLSLYLACGLDPEKSIVFAQSHVEAHAQLAWVLNCITPMGDLSRMTQYKEKSQKHAENINAGLFGYPVLMAADILLYGTDLVPVGEDQKQHLELTRDLAEKFNKLYGETFVIPEPFIPPVGARIMSLLEPEKKMSKSDTNLNNIITLLDKPEEVVSKIKRAVTDSEGIVAFDKTRPGITNLVTIYNALSGESFEDIEKKFAGQGYGIFKPALAEVINNFLAPMQERFYKIRKDKAYLHEVLASGKKRAKERADAKLREVYEKIGFIVL